MHIMQQPLLEPGDGPIVLTLCPTRELASQIEENVQNFCSPCRLRCRSVFGGVPKREQIAMLTRGPIEFLVATPGRLLDLIDSDVVSLTRTSLLVLDEADKMLNMGFQLFIRKIEVLVRPDRQTVLLSATMPKEIEEIAHVLCAKKTATQPPSPGLNAQRVGCVTVRIGTDLQYLQQPPGGGAGETGSATPPAEGEDPQVLLYASSEFSACRNIAQRVVVVEAFDDRLRAVEAEVAAAPRPHKILVFCNTKVGVEDLSTRLTRTFSQPPPGPANGGAEQAVEILSIHGGLPQTERTSVVARFKEPAAKDGVVVLVATGLMSRGVEVPDVGLVICFDFPPSVEEYVHRIGRTGRAGAKGASLAFVTHKSYSLIPDLVEFLDQAGSDVPAAVEALLPGGKRKRTLVTADGAGGPPAAKRGRAAVIEAPRLAKSAWRKTGPAVGARPQPGGGGGPGPEGPQDEHEEREEPQLQQQLQPQETVTYFACNPSPVLLLRNVCAPGNVDPTLKEDFWEECERLAGGKGTVLDVVVYEVCCSHVSRHERVPAAGCARFPVWKPRSWYLVGHVRFLSHTQALRSAC
ncbi:ATP-dependent RNA helicase DBP2 [Diplonema papillatum]|nr:ATP-dependent RNA helicase DBP2 [Diplonema papillatum]